MPARPRSRDIAAERARSLRLELGRGLRDARLDRDLSLRDVARATGISAPQGSRIERGLIATLSIEQVVRFAAAVGLDFSGRLYPGASPIRDAAHLALLGRLRDTLHPTLAMATEVPLPAAGDRRAWDAVIRGPDWVLAVEAETRPRDVQSLERRVALKMRDSGIERVLLLLLRSRHNARLVREQESLRVHFPGRARGAITALAAGERPDASAILML